jgi:hypothetical protein
MAPEPKCAAISAAQKRAGALCRYSPLLSRNSTGIPGLSYADIATKIGSTEGRVTQSASYELPPSTIVTHRGVTA